MTSETSNQTFQSRTFPLRVHSGEDALSSVPKELKRLGVTRGLILCGNSVRNKSGLTQKIEQLCEGRIAGVYAGIREGAPAEDIDEAAELARSLDADVLIAVGAGSVLKGARVVAMKLGENKPLTELATIHEEGKAPVSRRLLAPKVPIINILTSPTSAQNRAGSAVRYSGSAHHLEFFDPKTRPEAVFWDTEALATAPHSLMRSTSFEIYWWGLMCMGTVDSANPLVQASRRHAWHLARDAYAQLSEPPADARPLIDLCAAALLQNRDEEDGGRPWACHLAARAAYASAVALFNSTPGVTQSHGYAAFGPPMLRALGHLIPDVVAKIGIELGLQVTASDTNLAEIVADRLSERFRELGWKPGLLDYGVTAADAPKLLSFALHNYNANHDQLLDKHKDAILAGIERGITGA